MGKGEQSTSSVNLVGWKRICDLSVLNLVKVFLSKAVNEVLSTKRNLYRRKITDNVLCPIRAQEEIEVKVSYSVELCCCQDVCEDSQSFLQKWNLTDERFYNI